MIIKIDMNPKLASFLRRFFTWTGLALGGVVYLAGISYLAGDLAYAITGKVGAGVAVSAVVFVTQVITGVVACVITSEDK